MSEGNERHPQLGIAWRFRAQSLGLGAQLRLSMRRRILLSLAVLCAALLLLGLERHGVQGRRVQLFQSVVILEDGIPDDRLGSSLKSFLIQRFVLPVRVEKSFMEFSSAYRSGRSQWDYTVMLATVSARLSGPGRGVLLTSKDTFGGARNNWSTGIAASPGLAAIVSTHRLDPGFWGQPRNDALFYQRVRKILLHELGHTFGKSAHCDDPACVMHQSDSIGAIDQSGDDYCTRCKAVAQAAVANLKK